MIMSLSSQVNILEVLRAIQKAIKEAKMTYIQKAIHIMLIICNNYKQTLNLLSGHRQINLYLWTEQEDNPN